MANTSQNASSHELDEKNNTRKECYHSNSISHEKNATSFPRKYRWIPRIPLLLFTFSHGEYASFNDIHSNSSWILFYLLKWVFVVDGANYRLWKPINSHSINITINFSWDKTIHKFPICSRSFVSIEWTNVWQSVVNGSLLKVIFLDSSSTYGISSGSKSSQREKMQLNYSCLKSFFDHFFLCLPMFRAGQHYQLTTKLNTFSVLVSTNNILNMAIVWLMNWRNWRIDWNFPRLYKKQNADRKLISAV